MKWAKHAILRPPTDEELARMDAEQVVELHEAYHEAIRNAEEDPLRWGFELEWWRDADAAMVGGQLDELFVSGGNRSAKTSFGARSMVKAAIENPESRLWCFAQDDAASVRVQQKAVYDWLPIEFKKTVKSGSAYIKYSLKNGFTGNSLIVPETRSEIFFHTYTQFLNNPGKFEGYELGSYNPKWINWGWWLDEYLQGPNLINSLRFRLVTRDAKGLLTFTPIDGYTAFVGEYLKGARTLEKRPAELLGGRMLPYRQEASGGKANILYAFTEYNPFGGYDRLKRDLGSKPETEILVRAYGHPTKMVEGQFPKFRRDVHVMPKSEMEWVRSKDAKVTRYMVLDPAPSKPWYMLWIAVDEDGVWYVYREWPDIGWGEWAEIGENGKSKGGSAEKPLGYGIDDYAMLIKELEKKEVIYERLIDPRMGASPKQVKDGTITLMDQLDEAGFLFLAAPGGEEDIGIQLLQGLISYNVEKPVDAANRPMFYISDACENTISCLLNYTGSEGYKEAWRDAIDCMRYAATAEIRHVTGASLVATRRGKGGY